MLPTVIAVVTPIVVGMILGFRRGHLLPRPPSLAS